MSDKFERSYKIFRDNGCVINETLAENDLDDEDRKDIFLFFKYGEILESLDLNHMKKHIINCMASLIEVTERVIEMNLKNELGVSKQRTDLTISENKVFGAAVSMMSQELVEKSYNDILDAYPDVTSIDWNPLALGHSCRRSPIFTG